MFIYTCIDICTTPKHTCDETKVRTLGVSAVKLSDELNKSKLEERSQLRAVVVLLANPLLLSRPRGKRGRCTVGADSWVKELSIREA